MLKIGVLGSTRGTDLQAVIDAIEAKELNAEIAVVVSDKPDAFILERAKSHGIKTEIMDFKAFASREEADKKVSEIFESNGVELILLIGYMKLLSNWFVHKYENRIMNIHPSLLPAFAGGMDKGVHETILEAGVKVSGCTLHFVDEGTDSGPIIMQKAVPVVEGETIDSLKEKVQKAEQEVIVKAVKLFGEGKIKVEGKIVHVIE